MKIDKPFIPRMSKSKLSKNKWLTEEERKEVYSSYLRDCKLPLSPYIEEYFLHPLAIPMAEEDREFFRTYFRERRPTDTITMSKNDSRYAATFWAPKDSMTPCIPADLIYAKTLPLTDFEIFIPKDPNRDDTAMTFQIFIDPEYKMVADKYISGEFTKPLPIGVVKFFINDLPGSYVYCVLVVDPKDNTVCFVEEVGWYNGNSKYEVAELLAYQVAIFEANMAVLLRIFYGIELLMLNPATKVIFSHPKVEVYDQPSIIKKGKPGKRKRKVVHIRHHYISGKPLEKVFEEAMTTVHESGKTFTRHTMCWYVVGHWRHLSNGTKTFVEGHWRGPMRAMKKNLDGGRDREIPLTTKQNNK